MNRLEWIRDRWAASVAQGVGAWIFEPPDAVLGVAVFRSASQPVIEVFENGFVYSGAGSGKYLYDELLGLELLDLRSLMKAQHTPENLVPLVVETAKGRFPLLVPLYVYSTLSGFLSALQKMR